MARLRIKTQTIADTQAKLRYAVSTVSRAVFDQVAAFVGNDHILENAFGDIDRTTTAAAKISLRGRANQTRYHLLLLGKKIESFLHNM